MIAWDCVVYVEDGDRLVAKGTGLPRYTNYISLRADVHVDTARGRLEAMLNAAFQAGVEAHKNQIRDALALNPPNGDYFYR